MKLKDKYIVNGSMGLSDVPYEVWDLSDGYQVTISLGKRVCGFDIEGPDGKGITYKVAKYLEVDMTPENMSFDDKGRELYLSPGIDCVGLNYTKPENYMEVLLKIEKIINEHFKNKEKK